MKYILLLIVSFSVLGGGYFLQLSPNGQFARVQNATPFILRCWINSPSGYWTFAVRPHSSGRYYPISLPYTGDCQ